MDRALLTVESKEDEVSFKGSESDSSDIIKMTLNINVAMLMRIVLCNT